MNYNKSLHHVTKLTPSSRFSSNRCNLRPSFFFVSTHSHSGYYRCQLFVDLYRPKIKIKIVVRKQVKYTH